MLIDYSGSDLVAKNQINLTNGRGLRVILQALSIKPWLKPVDTRGKLAVRI